MTLSVGIVIRHSQCCDLSFLLCLLQVWDFNGRCLHRMNAGLGHAVEISQVLLLKRSILVMGWERYMCGFIVHAFVIVRENVVLQVYILCLFNSNAKYETKCCWKMCCSFLQGVHISKIQTLGCFDAVTPS